MTVNFEGYVFHVQGPEENLRLLCITSEKPIDGVIIDSNAKDYVNKAVLHNFFTKDLREFSDCSADNYAKHQYQYGIFKNIMRSILSSHDGDSFLHGLKRYLHSDSVMKYYIERALEELA